MVPSSGHVVSQWGDYVLFGSYGSNVRKLPFTAFVGLAALTAACAAIGGPTTSGSAGDTNPATGASVASSGHLVVLSDPRHVTYSLTPANCHTHGNTPDTVLPDPTCTPGGIDPAVTQANLSTTICKSGYTSTVRPPSSQTSKAKRAQYAAYGIPANTTSELDHLVSLELGGNNDIANLWPEAGRIPNPKDKVENALHRAVCSGKVKLSAAQNAIARDWTTAEHDLGVG
jgi:hypothetical protein